MFKALQNLTNRFRQKQPPEERQPIPVVRQSAPRVQPQISVAPVVEPLYGPERMAVQPEMVEAMRSEVALAVQRGVVSPPTEAQWEMILSDHPATCVIAGAGSGKSTTLVLRVVFMWCHMGIRPEEMTVISFTRASCEELRKSLVRVLSFEPWRRRLSPDDAENLEARCRALVSTFHAALSRVSARAWGAAEWFDMFGSKESSARTENGLDNPFAISKLTSDQEELLKTTYRSLYNEDRVFRQHVVALLRYECDRHSLLRAQQCDVRGLRYASDRDKELAERVNARWGTEWMLPGVDPKPFVAFTVDKLPFYANGRIIKTGMPIFLSLAGKKDGSPLFTKEESIGEGKGKFPIQQALIQKGYIVSRFCDKQALHLDSTQRIEWLQYRLVYVNDDDFRNMNAPAFGVQLRGELAAADVVEAFYGQANFIESLGLEVSEACQRALSVIERDTLEWHFCAALARFWPAFEAQLGRLALPTRRFNRAFLDLGKQASKAVSIAPDAVRPFTHLLIDEFQDISPQIVAWLRGMQRRVRELGGSPSLMAIGDDWQSIYGWRGSAPELFVGFAQHFPSHPHLGGPKVCRMMDNFRSVEPILRDAERIVAQIKIKTDKQAIPRRPTDPQTDHGVRLIKGVDVRTKPEQVVQTVEEQLAFVRSLPKADKNKILILSRSNQTLDHLRRVLNKSGLKLDDGVRFETFHRAKGLQGEVAILLENCVYEESHPLRNAIYRVSGLFQQSYDDAARDEALRLAYVAVTRGIRRVFWFVDEPKGASALLDLNPR